MVSIPAVSPHVLEQLRQYDTPTVCNVIELFNVKPHNVGYMDHRIQCCFPQFPPMVGYAVTAMYGSDAPPEGGDVYGVLGRQVASYADLPGPPVMVFQDLDDPPVAATFGDLMCSTYQAFGAVGIVTSGAGRDLDQVEELKFPAFVGSIICSHAYAHIKSVNVPVRIGGMTVRPGDLLHGDRNGVTTIPHEIASEMPQALADFVAAEAYVLDYVKQPSPSIIGLQESAAQLRTAMKTLATRLRRQP